MKGKKTSFERAADQNGGKSLDIPYRISPILRICLTFCRKILNDYHMEDSSEPRPFSG